MSLELLGTVSDIAMTESMAYRLTYLNEVKSHGIPNSAFKHNVNFHLCIHSRYSY